MITVEELIVQSLRHKLLMVNVKRTGQPAQHTPVQGRTDGLGLLMLGAVSRQLQSSLGVQQQSLPAALTGPESLPLGPPGQVQAYDHRSEIDEDSPAGVALLTVRALQDPAARTVLDTEQGLRLVTAAPSAPLPAPASLHPAPSPPQPLWFFTFDPKFGPDMPSVPAEVLDRRTGSELQLANLSQLSTVNLAQCDQFSIIHYQDKENPDNSKVFVIQNTDAASTPGDEDSSVPTSSIPSSVPSSAPSSDSDASLPVSPVRPHRPRADRRAPGKPYTSSPLTSRDQRDADMDSGIWESSRLSAHTSHHDGHVRCSCSCGDDVIEDEDTSDAVLPRRSMEVPLAEQPSVSYKRFTVQAGVTEGGEACLTARQEQQAEGGALLAALEADRSGSASPLSPLVRIREVVSGDDVTDSEEECVEALLGARGAHARACDSPAELQYDDQYIEHALQHQSDTEEFISISTHGMTVPERHKRALEHGVFEQQVVDSQLTMHRVQDGCCNIQSCDEVHHVVRTRCLSNSNEDVLASDTCVHEDEMAFTMDKSAQSSVPRETKKVANSAPNDDATGPSSNDNLNSCDSIEHVTPSSHSDPSSKDSDSNIIGSVRKHNSRFLDDEDTSVGDEIVKVTSYHESAQKEDGSQTFNVVHFKSRVSGSHDDESGDAARPDKNRVLFIVGSSQDTSPESDEYHTVSDEDVQQTNGHHDNQMGAVEEASEASVETQGTDSTLSYEPIHVINERRSDRSETTAGSTDDVISELSGTDSSKQLKVAFYLEGDTPLPSFADKVMETGDEFIDNIRNVVHNKVDALKGMMSCPADLMLTRGNDVTDRTSPHRAEEDHTLLAPRPGDVTASDTDVCKDSEHRVVDPRRQPSTTPEDCDVASDVRAPGDNVPPIDNYDVMDIVQMEIDRSVTEHVTEEESESTDEQPGDRSHGSCPVDAASAEERHPATGGTPDDVIEQPYDEIHRIVVDRRTHRLVHLSLQQKAERIRHAEERDVTQSESEVTQTARDVTQTERDVTQTERDVTQTERDATQTVVKTMASQDNQTDVTEVSPGVAQSEQKPDVVNIRHGQNDAGSDITHDTLPGNTERTQDSPTDLNEKIADFFGTNSGQIDTPAVRLVVRNSSNDSVGAETPERELTDADTGAKQSLVNSLDYNFSDVSDKLDQLGWSEELGSSSQEIDDQAVVQVKSADSQPARHEEQGDGEADQQIVIEDVIVPETKRVQSRAPSQTSDAVSLEGKHVKHIPDYPATTDQHGVTTHGDRRRHAAQRRGVIATALDGRTESSAWSGRKRPDTRKQAPRSRDGDVTPEGVVTQSQVRRSARLDRRLRGAGLTDMTDRRVIADRRRSDSEEEGSPDSLSLSDFTARGSVRAVEEAMLTESMETLAQAEAGAGPPSPTAALGLAAAMFMGSSGATHADWMAELPARLHHVALPGISIPGSHISLAIEKDMRTDMDFAKCNQDMAEFLRKMPNYAVFNNFRFLMKRIWKNWMPKQILSVEQQLEAGVRYLDLHVTKHRNALYGEHGLYTRPLRKYLKEVKRFLDQHPREVVVLHFAALDQFGPADVRALLSQLHQLFGARLCNVTHVGCLTLHELWRNRKQVLAVFTQRDRSALNQHIFEAFAWSDAALRVTSPKQQTVPDLMTSLDAAYGCLPGKGDALEVLQAVVSPDLNMVFGDYEYRSMRELTMAETSRALCRWARDKVKVNVVLLDFVGMDDLPGLVINLNTVKTAETVV